MPDTLKLLPATSDYIFKQVFGTEENIDILRSFLKAVLVPPHNLENLRIENPDILPEEKENKEVIFDIKVSAGSREAGDREIMDIEIQALSTLDMRKRIVYYLGRIVSRHLGKTDKYKHVGKSIVIMVMNFNLVNDSHYYHRFRLHDPETGIELTDMIQVYTLELPKLPAEDDGTLRWTWLRLIAATDVEELEMLRDKDVEVDKASSVIQSLSINPDVREYEEAREKYQRHVASLVDDGREEGREEGLRIGLEKGGIREKYATARKMLARGKAIGEIIEFTGLSPEDIDKLRLN